MGRIQDRLGAASFSALAALPGRWLAKRDPALEPWGGLPILYGDGIHDDALALQALADGQIGRAHV